MSERVPGIVDPYKRPLTAADFEAILRYLPEFESLGHAAPRDGVDQASLSQLVMDFIDDLYQHGWIIDFDWVRWDLRRLLDEQPEIIPSASADTLRRLLTTHVRCDRYCEAHLLDLLESGSITAILRRLRKLYKLRSGPDARLTGIGQVPDMRFEGVGSIAREDVEAILHYLPAFEAPGVDFGHRVDPGPDVILLDDEVLSPLAWEFFRDLHRRGWLIGFDYLRWDGRHLWRRPDLIAEAQVTTLGGLLSGVVAGGRICTGLRLMTFESGGFTVILRRLQQLYDEGLFSEVLPPGQAPCER